MVKWKGSSNIWEHLPFFSNIKATYFSARGPELSACPGTSTWMKQDRSLISDMLGLLTKSWNDASLMSVKIMSLSVQKSVAMKWTHGCILNHEQWEILHVFLVVSNRPSCRSVIRNKEEKQKKEETELIKKCSQTRHKISQTNKQKQTTFSFSEKEIECTKEEIKGGRLSFSANILPGFSLQFHFN